MLIAIEGPNIVKSWFFCIETSLVLSLYQIVTLILFPFSIQNLNVIQEISVSNNPAGITIWIKKNRVIVVCEADNNCLQIF